ncbi:hypothetical protein [Streptomyces luteolus]|uniref:Uncharacterized protein n=1 Tax=Streptomyces luteolus TaxID=3043615 RepID=A0ABT6T306_9ACTN|nr:hypothetical protein [Streptomyces sp. B-S-A12]MDI3421748.1 hypothetical protein [Streptomyces sp. B-S-A12]
MRRSFKIHAGIAAGYSVILLVLASLTLLPQPLVLPDSPWLVAGIVGPVIPLVAGAVIRGNLGGSIDRRTTGIVFQQLPLKLRLAMGSLVIAGFALTFTAVQSGDRQSPEVVDGRYFVFDTTPGERGHVEVSRSEYEAARTVDQRTLLAVPGTMAAGASGRGRHHRRGAATAER